MHDHDRGHDWPLARGSSPSIEAYAGPAVGRSTLTEDDPTFASRPAGGVSPESDGDDGTPSGEAAVEEGRARAKSLFAAFGPKPKAASASEPVEGDEALIAELTALRDAAVAEDRAAGTKRKGHAGNGAAPAPWHPPTQSRGTPPPDYVPPRVELTSISVGKGDDRLARLVTMLSTAPEYGPTGIRTPMPYRDGLSVLITALVIDCIRKFLPKATGTDRETLIKALDDHMTLLETPWNKGGHRTVGAFGNVKGKPKKLDALVGCSTPKTVAVNQTATLLAALWDLDKNAYFDEAQAGTRAPVAAEEDVQHADDRGMQIFKEVVGELKSHLAANYSGAPDKWKYGSSGRLEDEKHLKTTLGALNRLADKNHFYGEWAATIKAAYPIIAAGENKLKGKPGLRRASWRLKNGKPTPPRTT